MNASSHQTELNKFLTYLKSKKENCFKEAEQTVDDFKADNASGQIFNKEDVNTIFSIWH